MSQSIEEQLSGQTRTLRGRAINVVITHEDEERVDVLVSTLEDAFYARIFCPRDHHIILAPIIPDLKCVLESRVRREIWDCHARESVCGTRLAWYVPGGSDGLQGII